MRGEDITTATQSPLTPEALAGETIVVTGGAHGIGWATVELCTRLGARVAIWDLDEVAATHAAMQMGVHVPVVRVDVVDPESIETGLDRTVSALRTITGLVNCAGSAGAVIGIPYRPLVESSASDIDVLVDLNLKSAMHCCRIVVPEMIKEGRGAIVNVSSRAGIIGVKDQSIYSGAKAGVITFTRALSKELGEHGIRVNGVAPGVIDTRIWDYQPAGRTATTQSTSSALRRPGAPSEVAAVIATLLSPAMSYVTGVTIPVDGGY